MNRRRLAAIVAALSVASACAPAGGVEVERAEPIDGPLTPDRPTRPSTEAGSDDPSPDGPSSTPDGAPTTSIVFGPCDDVGIPDRVTEGTSGWECGRLVVAMDPFGDSDDLPPVELAVTRHRATGERLGAIVLNPGGPGGGGLPAAWGLRPALPLEILRGFDVVSWDPRGVGRSEPRLTCGGADSFRVGYIASCVEETGVLSSYVAAPYSAADMEALRVGLGEPELDFLGFSYGSALGATYASMYPDRVGSFVLDGVIDPLAGSEEGPFEDGFAVFSRDGRPDAFDRLVELCDATERCLPGADAREAIDGLRTSVASLPTDDFEGGPPSVDADGLDEVVDDSLMYAGDWELLATALGDASAGDASSLASLVADTSGSSDGDGGEPDGDGEFDDSVPPDPGDPRSYDNFRSANFMIYCADFARLITRWTFCDGMPANDRFLLPVEPVDVETPILVIGTEFDPLTPGENAPPFADALGDASHLIWEGVGHTAFPGWTPCVDDAVVDQFVRGERPPDGTRCAMVLGVDDDAELADQLFGYGSDEARSWMTDSLRSRDEVADPSCVASSLVSGAEGDRVDDRLVSHVILDVTSDLADVALTAASARC